MIYFKKSNRMFLLAIAFLILSIPIHQVVSHPNDNIEKIKTKLEEIPFNEFFLSEMFSNVNESKLYQYVKTISDFGPHPTGSTSLENVIDHIYNQFFSMNIQVEFDSWSAEGESGNNIVATLPGETDKLVIVTAHSDTVEVSPGADDDGSGISSILVIAEIMSKYSFSSTVKFIIFSGEEIGLLGSNDYAKRAYDNDYDIIGVLSLDKIGYAKTSDEGNTIRHHASPESDWMIDISEEISELYFEQIGLEVKRLPFDGSSDHKAFVNIGFPGSNLVEEALNPNYHTSEDTIDYINASYLAKVTKLAIGITSKMASIEPVLAEDDLEISIKGSFLSKPSRLDILIINNKFPEDTANVSISIEMFHIFRDSYVYSLKEFYKEPCIWNYTKEINQEWLFRLGGKVFSRGFLRLEVTIRGLADDISYYQKVETKGFVFFPNKILIRPII